MNLGYVPPPFYEEWRRRRPEFEFQETPSMTVMGMAAGMSPVETIESQLAGINPEDQRRLLWANAAELYGLDEDEILSKSP